METLIWVLHILFAIAVVVLVLLQQGKGADMGAAFGSGSAGSLFGASGSANFLSRTTAVLATLFFATSLVLTFFSADGTKVSGVADQVPVKSVPAPGKAGESGATGDAGSKAGEIPR
jgi:preprotein translocase subunit SecG